MRVSDKLKAVVAAVGTVVTALTAAFADDVLSVDETGSIIATAITAGLTAWATWRVPNKPAAQQRR